MKRILILDNFDSFTYNLVHAVEAVSAVLPEVVRNDAFDIAAASEFTHIILSPGPGLPAEAGVLLPLIAACGAEKKILGVCLGHQAIGLTYGAQLKNLARVKHGVSGFATKLQPEDPLLASLPAKFEIGHYHSWVLDPATIPNCLRISATDEEGNIMAISHKAHAVKGVQFHPESILTPQGRQIIKNFLS